MTNIEVLEEEIERAKHLEFQQKLNEKRYQNMLEKKQKQDKEKEKKALNSRESNGLFWIGVSRVSRPKISWLMRAT